MKDNCLDIGILQAFMDCELSQAESLRVSGHVADCSTCALLLAQAEDEAAVVFPALEREFNTLVPTQRLWSKINESIVTEHKTLPIWTKALAFLTGAFSTPSLAAAAGLLIVVGIFSIVWLGQTAAPDDVAVNPVRLNSALSKDVTPIVTASIPPTADQDEVSGPELPVRVEQAAYRPRERRSASRPAAYVETSVDPSATDRYMPGEESYIKTISSLGKVVEGQKQDTMRPSQRVAYERDMAVVNDAIKKMRLAVEKDPKNESARRVLYSSYQNKIDLLNSVSQKEELMASLR